jgi:hypothetical protein
MCMNESQLIRHLNQPCDAVAAHLKQCEACRVQFAILQRTWRLLGEYDDAVPQHDLLPRVLAALPRRDWSWARVAAGLLIAAGVGAAAASSTGQPTAPTETSGQTVIEAMGLDAIGADTGLADLWLDNGPGEERSL